MNRLRILGSIVLFPAVALWRVEPRSAARFWNPFNRVMTPAEMHFKA